MKPLSKPKFERGAILFLYIVAIIYIPSIGYLWNYLFDQDFHVEGRVYKFNIGWQVDYSASTSYSHHSGLSKLNFRNPWKPARTIEVREFNSNHFAEIVAAHSDNEITTPIGKLHIIHNSDLPQELRLNVSFNKIIGVTSSTAIIFDSTEDLFSAFN
jgi:hypothetical protein